MAQPAIAYKSQTRAVRARCTDGGHDRPAVFVCAGSLALSVSSRLAPVPYGRPGPAPAARRDRNGDDGARGYAGVAGVAGSGVARVQRRARRQAQGQEAQMTEEPRLLRRLDHASVQRPATTTQGTSCVVEGSLESLFAERSLLGPVELALLEGPSRAAVVAVPAARVLVGRQQRRLLLLETKLVRRGGRRWAWWSVVPL